MADLIDTVVRFHDVRRLPELTRAIFSLVGQSYRPLRIILLTQRFTDEEVATTRAALAPFLDDTVDFDLINWIGREPADARSVLLNLGVNAARGRYLAFLDYDDALHPDAYAIMVARLVQSGAAIVFASVRVMQLRVYDRYFHAEKRLPPFKGKDLLDLFRGNFCPLHSYVIDRDQVAPELLMYQGALLMEEDYDVLLRICARYRTDFALIGTDIGDYYYKTDGSNTVPVNGVLTPESQERYKGVRVAIEHRKRTTAVSDIAQNAVGIPSSGRVMSIRDVLDHYS